MSSGLVGRGAQLLSQFSRVPTFPRASSFAPRLEDCSRGLSRTAWMLRAARNGNLLPPLARLWHQGFHTTAAGHGLEDFFDSPRKDDERANAGGASPLLFSATQVANQFSKAELLDRSVLESVRTAPEKLGGPSQALVSSAVRFSQGSSF